MCNITNNSFHLCYSYCFLGRNLHKRRLLIKHSDIWKKCANFYILHILCIDDIAIFICFGVYKNAVNEKIMLKTFRLLLTNRFSPADNCGCGLLSFSKMGCMFMLKCNIKSSSYLVIEIWTLFCLYIYLLLQFGFSKSVRWKFLHLLMIVGM